MKHCWTDWGRDETDLPQTLHSVESRGSPANDNNAVAVGFSPSCSQLRRARQVGLQGVGGIGSDMYLSVVNLNLERVQGIRGRSILCWKLSTSVVLFS